MKWITTDYKGNKKVWYSEDVINKIKERCKKEKVYDPIANYILNFLDEVEQ